MSSATLEVTIMGQSYVLACPEGEQDALREAVAEVDREMCSIRDLGKIRARERIAVLAALNLAHAKRLAAAGVPASAPGESAVADLPVRLRQLQQKLDAALDSDGQLL
ncbi:cell division protein ZapA [Thiomonas sp. FB-Cd]|uniref:cell division protein ZapA n=1 Tax=Thiomonas sp. FB-Cd TaxID=1158292 RepID=UPI00056DAB0B|nr:cell division protein ZapA [Thiomonas sp. FB-Cd]